MKFKLVKEGCNNVNAYHLEGLSTGDVVELTGHFERKAQRNPDFEEVKPPVKKAVKKTVKKAVKK